MLTFKVWAVWFCLDEVTSDCFLVAYKHFVDMVPTAMDNEAIRGLERNLELVLRDGLQLTGIDVHERCATMLQESPAVLIIGGKASLRRGVLMSLLPFPRHEVGSSFSYPRFEGSGMRADGLEEPICVGCSFNTFGNFFFEIIENSQYITKWVVRGQL